MYIFESLTRAEVTQRGVYSILSQPSRPNTHPHIYTRDLKKRRAQKIALQTARKECTIHITTIF